MLRTLLKSLKLALVLLVSGQLVLGSPIERPLAYSVKESHQVPDNWHCVGRADPYHRIRLHIGLKQHRISEIERHLYEGRMLQSQTISF